jgi:hypothetical protein
MASKSVQITVGEDVSTATRGDVKVEINTSNDNGEAAPEVGDIMPEGHAHAGRIYLGPSASTGRPLYAASQDSGVYKWREAMDFAAKQNNGASVPTQDELDQLYEARDTGALKGTFNLTGYDPAAWYWSSTAYRDDADGALSQDFGSDDGYQDWNDKDHHSSLRLVWS